MFLGTYNFLVGNNLYLYIFYELSVVSLTYQNFIYEINQGKPR